MRRIAIINQKGGVGKTTSAVNLGAALARKGRRVLAIDLDPQANLSMYLGVETRPGEPSSYSVLSGSTRIAESVLPTRTPGLLLLPSHIDLSGAELELASTIGRETILRDAIDEWERTTVGTPPVDYVLIDCPPSLGLLSINALAAVQEVYLAVQTEFFALQGLSKLVEVVQLLRRRLNPGLTITGLLPCLYDSRLKLAREVLAELRRFFPGKVFQSSIRTNVKLAESPSHGQTIFEYAPDSNGALDYARLADEVLAQEAAMGIAAPRDIGGDEVIAELERTARQLRAAETAPLQREPVPAPEAKTEPEALAPQEDVPAEAVLPPIEEETEEVGPTATLQPQPPPAAAQPSRPQRTETPTPKPQPVAAMSHAAEAGEVDAFGAGVWEAPLDSADEAEADASPAEDVVEAELVEPLEVEPEATAAVPVAETTAISPTPLALPRVYRSAPFSRAPGWEPADVDEEELAVVEPTPARVPQLNEVELQPTAPPEVEAEAEPELGPELGPGPESVTESEPASELETATAQDEPVESKPTKATPPPTPVFNHRHYIGEDRDRLPGRSGPGPRRR